MNNIYIYKEVSIPTIFILATLVGTFFGHRFHNNNYALYL